MTGDEEQSINYVSAISFSLKKRETTKLEVRALLVMDWSWWLPRRTVAYPCLFT